MPQLLESLNENKNMTAAPPQWLAAPSANNEGAGLLGRAVEAFEGYLDARVRNSMYDRFVTSAPTLSAAQKETFKNNLQPGDIILVSDDRLPNWRIFEGVLGASPRWNHAALYAGDGVIIESGGKIRENVHRVTVDTFLDTHHAAIVRPRYGEGGADRAVQYVIEQLGKPYDGRFNISDDAFYCSELVGKAVEAGGVEVPQSDVVFKSDDSNFWQGLASTLSTENMKPAFKALTDWF